MKRLRMFALLVVLIAVSAQPVAAAEPKLTVAAPKNGDVLKADSFMVTFQTANIQIVPSSIPVSEAGKHPEANKVGEGHLHFVLDLQPLIVWEQTAPYTFTNVPPGEHRLMVEIVNNDHSSLSPRVMQTISFRVEGPGMLPSTSHADALPQHHALILLGLAALIILLGAALTRRATL